VGDKWPIVPVNSVVRDVQELYSIPIRPGRDTVYLRDVAKVADFMDAPTGYALANGRRAVYILATKRAEASTLNVINNIKKALPDMQAALGADAQDIRISFEFDQSPYVTRAVASVVSEGLLGAVLVGLMILLFLRDWRSSLVVVLNIPFALMSAVVALWITGQTINLMTLGGLALAIGILVDEATVAIENIHAHLARGKTLAVAVRDGSAETAIPRLLAMLCILAVFVSAFFMQGAAQALFVPLSLAVGFSMLASYILSSTFVPVMCVWLLRHAHHEGEAKKSFFDRLRSSYEAVLTRFVSLRWIVVPAYLIVTIAAVPLVGSWLGREIFPVVDAGQFRLRLRAPDGSHINFSEQIAKDALALIADEVGPDNVELTLGYVGAIHSSYPINGVYQWSRGPEEAILLVDINDEIGLSIEELKERLRDKFAEKLPGVRFSFEPADIVNEVMSFGSPTPVEISVNGPNFGESRAFAQKVYAKLAEVDALRDLQYGQSLDYPTIEVKVDRERAGLAGLTPADVSRSLVTATSSSRFVVPNFWADPKSGIAYQVQVEIPRPVVRAIDGVQMVGSTEDLGRIPLKRTAEGQVLVRDVANLSPGTMPGQYDRYNMRRQVTMTANIADADLGTVGEQVAAALARAGEPPAGMKVEVRGQIPPMQEMQNGLTIGLGLAILVVFLLLAANYQSIRLSLATVSTAPAVVLGVVLMLLMTRTTLNIQSFIGAIMAIGVAMANAILLVTFAEQRRRESDPDAPGVRVTAQAAAVQGAGSRLRAILMTSCAMIAGMLPMALGLGEAGQQNAPLGRAVIGGLVAATAATLFVLPCVFAMIQARVKTASVSLDPGDPASPYFSAPDSRATATGGHS
jgi:multidrug efflux pump subunit AcrB